MKRVKFWTRFSRENYDEWKLVWGDDHSNVPTAAWKAYNKAFWEWKSHGAFYPIDDLEAYQYGVSQMISAAEKIRYAGQVKVEGEGGEGEITLINAAPSTYLVACAYLALCKHKEREVDPTREMHRALFEEVIVGANDKPDAPRREIRAFVESLSSTRAFAGEKNRRIAAITVYETLPKLEADTRRGFEAWLKADGLWLDAAKLYGASISTYQYRFHNVWTPAFINACTWRW